VLLSVICRRGDFNKDIIIISDALFEEEEKKCCFSIGEKTDIKTD
jgi:hypothetical protein